MFKMFTRSAIRNFSTQSLNVVNDVAKQQFTISMFGAFATVDYKRNGNVITYIHTNVPQQFQGKGVGKILAKYAFDFAKEEKLDVTCHCHFLGKYYNENQEQYKNLKVVLELE